MVRVGAMTHIVGLVCDVSDVGGRRIVCLLGWSMVFAALEHILLCANVNGLPLQEGCQDCQQLIANPL